MAEMFKRYMADFETVNDEEDCRVWAWALCRIGSESVEYGKDIESFMQYIFTLGECKIYFHNLKFDGEFIISYLLKNSYKWVKEKPGNYEFTTLISFKGQFYTLKVGEIEIIDSLKILPFSVHDIANAFNIEEKKGEIDYNLYRPIGWELTIEEKEYIKNDVIIVSKALTELFNNGLTKITQGSNALSDYKGMEKDFKRRFPIIDKKIDNDIRLSYKGGFTYLNEKYAGVNLNSGIVLDVNSLYPWVMYECRLPFGEPLYFDGKYKDDLIYNIYCQYITCNFELKEGYLPTIQLKNNMGFVPTEYIKSSNGEDVTMCMTSVDLKLFFEHYNVYNVEYQGGFKFKSSNKFFKSYIDKWMAVKIESTKNGNKSMRTLAKLMLNALYGKFGTNPTVISKIPYINEDGIVKYKNAEPETREPIYIPLASFVTAYARDKTIRSAQKLIDRFVYADTDSLHLIGTDMPQELEIDPVKLGAWKHESTFTRARFIRAKSYVEEIDGELKVTCAGLPKRCHNQVTFENFNIGMEYKGKLTYRHVPNGVMLKDTNFTIKG